MKRPWAAKAVVMGICLVAIAAFGAQAAPQASPRSALRLLLDADLLDQPVFAQIQPRLEAFSAATDAGDLAAFGGLTAPGFRLVTKPGAGETGPKAQQEAVSLLDYATGDGQPQDRQTSRTLSVRKFYPESGKLGLFLEDEGGWSSPPTKNAFAPTGRDITRHWAMTWVNTDGDWKLLTLAYVKDAPISASTPAPSAVPVPLVFVEDALATQLVAEQLLPQIRAYAVALDAGSIAGYRRLLAPDFRFKNRNDGEETGQKALRDALSFVLTMRDVEDVKDIASVPKTLTVQSDHSHYLTGHVVTIDKFFQKPGTVVIFLKDTMDFQPPLPTKFGLLPLSGTWDWKQTWISTADGWRLRQVTEF